MIAKKDSVIVIKKNLIIPCCSAEKDWLTENVSIKKFFCMSNNIKSSVSLPPTSHDIFVYDESHRIKWVADCYVLEYDQNLYQVLSSSKDVFQFEKILKALDVRSLYGKA